MSKTMIQIGGRGKQVYLDVVEVNASDALEKALSTATGVTPDCHMMLDRGCLPLLQGIGTASDQMQRECSQLMHIVNTNGIVIICPRPA